MKLTVAAFLLSLSFSSFSFTFTPAGVKCLQDAKKKGLKMEQAYQTCSVITDSFGSKKKK